MSRRFCIWLHYTLIFRQFPQKHFVYVCLFLPTQGHYQMIYHFFTPYYIPNFYKFIWFMCILQASWTVGHTFCIMQLSCDDCSICVAGKGFDHSFLFCLCFYCFFYVFKKYGIWIFSIYGRFPVIS